MLLAVLRAAADVEDDLPQGRTHLDLDESGVLDVAGQGKDLGALALAGALSGEPGRTVRDDPRERSPMSRRCSGGRLIEVASLDRVDVLGPGSPTSPSSEAISAVDSPQTNAPRAASDLDVEAEVGPQDPVSQTDPASTPVRWPRVCASRPGDTRCGRTRSPGREPIAYAPIIIPSRIEMRIPLEQPAVHVRAGVPLVRVADDVACPARRIPALLPLPAGRVSTTAAAPQTREP